jgi:serine/threonine-protein kinase
MGRVYVAEHVRMGRKSALKVMSPALATTADAITRFNREASNASRINHPNVAAIYDFGETADGLLYIAMEFVEGETLHALIQRTGPLPIARAARITRGAADALHAAHHLGIIHRDLKPDNIMLARQLDGSDWVKVVDFGIAKSVAAQGQGGRGGQTVTTAGVSLGTPEYMSPEQLAGEQLDHHTDIYSLGLVLFNMLTGELPYPKLTSKETLVRRLTSPPATLADVRPDVAWPAAVQAVLTRALDPEPARRYDSVADLGRAIEAAAGALPATAGAGADDPTVRVAPVDRPAAALAATSAHRPPAPAVRRSATTRKLAEPRPRRGPQAALAAAALLLVSMGGYALVHARRAAPGSPPSVAIDSSHDTAASTPRAPAPAAIRDAATPPATPLEKPVVKPSAQSAPPETTSTQTVPSVPKLEGALAAVRGHMQTAGRLVAQGNPVAAMEEIRAGQAGIKAIRESTSGGKLPGPVERQIREMPGAAVRACFTAAAGDQGGMQRCRTFQQREARGARGRVSTPGG